MRSRLHATHSIANADDAAARAAAFQQVPVRDAGGPEPLAASLGQWRERLTERGQAMLTGAARLADYIDSGSAPTTRPR